MSNFGKTIRDLRNAQDLGLRETASRVGISPAYLSRIERGKESPPRVEIIKDLARVLAADPDVLFRLSYTTDPDVTDFLRSHPKIMNLVRYIKDSDFTDPEIDEILHYAVNYKSKSFPKDQSAENSHPV